jgi:nucleoside 2-deoxyribosyltransferase
VRVYVAGSSEQLDRVEAAMSALEERGHSIAHDWVTPVRTVGEANPPYGSLYARLKWARDDLAGVDSAQVLWVLMPSKEGFGAGVELGYAIARGIPIVCSGSCSKSIFTAFATLCTDRDDQALDQYFQEIL